MVHFASCSIPVEPHGWFYRLTSRTNKECELLLRRRSASLIMPGALVTLLRFRVVRLSFPSECHLEAALQFGRPVTHCGSVMRVSARGVLAVSWSGSLMAFLALGVAMPSVARAGCSNPHVTSGSQATAGSARLELLDLAGALNMPQKQTPSRQPVPCSGAMCSGNPATPSSTIPSIPRASGEQWADSLVYPALIGSGPFAYPDFDHTIRPVDRLCLIFHPPRYQSVFPAFDGVR